MCRINNTSRSRGESAATAAMTASRSSWRIARLLGLVSCATNWRPSSTADSSEISAAGVSRVTLRLCANRWRRCVFLIRYAGKLPEPGQERQRLIAQILVQLTGGIGQGLLHDIRGIHARSRRGGRAGRRPSAGGGHGKARAAHGGRTHRRVRPARSAHWWSALSRSSCDRLSSIVFTCHAGAKPAAKYFEEFASGSGTDG